MKETRLFSDNNCFSGSILRDTETDFFEISISLLKPVVNPFVLRAYFLDCESTNLINMGIIETSGEKGFLKVKNSLSKDTVVIMMKNAETGDLKYISSAFFKDEWNVFGYLNHSVQNTNLYKIKKKIKEEIRFYQKYEENTSFYKVTDFRAIANLSSVKCILFEKSVMYSFDKYGFYLFSLDKDTVTVGVLPVNDENPLVHIKDFSSLEKGIYCAKVTLCEDGQYFVEN